MLALYRQMRRPKCRTKPVVRIVTRDTRIEQPAQHSPDLAVRGLFEKYDDYDIIEDEALKSGCK